MAEAPGDAKAVKQDDKGKYLDAKGDPTFSVQAGWTVDWYTYSGFRRYHSECHVCHGPDAEGSTYAPALKDSVKRLNYQEYFGIVVAADRTSPAAKTRSCRRSAITKTSCAISTIFMFISVQGRTIRSLADGRKA